jgi:hypothetical protein
VSELDDLTQQQQSELNLGRFQPAQAGMVSLSDGMELHLSDEGFERNQHRRQRQWECPEHGQAFGRVGWGGRPYCNACHYEAMKKWRDKNREHYNATIRAYKHSHPEYRVKERERARERRATDPEYRERRRAQKRAYDARQRALKERTA